MKTKQKIDSSSSPDKNSSLLDQIKELKSLIISEKAENDNLRKRFERELNVTKDFAISNFVKYFTEQIENLFRALDSINLYYCKKNPEVRVLFEGINITKKNLLKIFLDFKIERLYPFNTKFDYRFHEAIAQVFDDSKPSDTILTVVQAGYKMNNRLIKPAIVIVSKKD